MAALILVFNKMTQYVRRHLWRSPDPSPWHIEVILVFLECFILVSVVFGKLAFLFSGVACLDWAVREGEDFSFSERREKTPFDLIKSLIYLENYLDGCNNPYPCDIQVPSV